MTGLRCASKAERQAPQVADLVLREAAIQKLFSQVDAVHVLTSLADFEALLRGAIEVHTWGLHFYGARLPIPATPVAGVAGRPAPSRPWMSCSPGVLLPPSDRFRFGDLLPGRGKVICGSIA
jgi:hypothetical protein